MLPLRTAIRSKASTEVIDALIRAAPEVVKQFGVSGKTCLHLACLYSMDFDLFHELLTLWPDATKWKDRDGWCVLLLVASFETKLDCLTVTAYIILRIAEIIVVGIRSTSPVSVTAHRRLPPPS
jgi:hypothetical protein